MSADLHGLGRVLIVGGLALTLFGLFLVMGPKLPWLGRLPGDIIIRREHVTFYFPLATSLLASLIFTVVVWLIGRFKH